MCRKAAAIKDVIKPSSAPCSILQWAFASSTVIIRAIPQPAEAGIPSGFRLWFLVCFGCRQLGALNGNLAFYQALRFLSAEARNITPAITAPGLGEGDQHLVSLRCVFSFFGLLSHGCYS